jgi:hypothetical protein
MSNVYYSPEDFGLEIVGTLEDEPNYDFNMVVVWKDKDGVAYWAHDSGCSCPCPFEDYQTVDSLEVLNKQSWDGFESACNNLYQVSRDEVDRFLRLVEREVGRV